MSSSHFGHQLRGRQGQTWQPRGILGRSSRERLSRSLAVETHRGTRTFLPSAHLHLLLRSLQMGVSSRLGWRQSGSSKGWDEGDDVEGGGGTHTRLRQSRVNLKSTTVCICSIHLRVQVQNYHYHFFFIYSSSKTTSPISITITPWRHRMSTSLATMRSTRPSQTLPVHLLGEQGRQQTCRKVLLRGIAPWCFSNHIHIRQSPSSAPSKCASSRKCNRKWPPCFGTIA